MERKASVVWEGGLKDGHGKLTTSSGALSNVDYSFRTRFEDQPGTNPEELIAAAHAGCFSMALAGQLVKRGMKPRKISTTGTVTLEKVEDGWSVTSSHLETVAEVPGADEVQFNEAAQEAKVGCPISRLLNAPSILNAKLEAGTEAEKKAG